ncbi:hypothetical protein ZIOFF_007063 [Zingiber officinale]|uniref:Protein FAR1-RELATED SEQUENCE n=1 Tax=Zingiber officinale TaxID=94328 RepID=A0A8J5HQG9_ZINOF|nr:hypothetical protein ZIOFF_007063 [Zingiber officinale]
MGLVYCRGLVELDETMRRVDNREGVAGRGRTQQRHATRYLWISLPVGPIIGSSLLFAKVSLYPVRISHRKSVLIRSAERERERERSASLLKPFSDQPPPLLPVSILGFLLLFIIYANVWIVSDLWIFWKSLLLSWKYCLQESLSEKMYVFGGCNRKRKKSTFVTPTVLFAPLHPVTPAQIDGSTSTTQSLVQMWPSPLVLLSSTTAWPTQPPVMSTSEHSFVQRADDKDMASIDATKMGNIISKWLPRVDMLFDSENDAYEFYNTYAENEGFIVRRSKSTVSTKNIITKRTFVCSREGFREKKKGEKEAKCPRPVTRIGCPACMTIRLASNGKYRVTEFMPNHNHQLATVATFDKLRAKKLRRNARVARADLVDDTVRLPEFETEDEAYEFYSAYAGRMGFRVRKTSATISAENLITRRMFVCSREGFREQKKGEKRVKKPRKEFRTGCPACMVIRISSTGKYQVTEFVTFHNHQLEASSSADSLTSQTAEISTDFVSVIASESADDDASKQIGSPQNCNKTELLSFFEHYDRILSEKRFAELQADVNASQSTQKPPSMRLLRQAANAYTPAAYKMFEREFELYMDCVLFSCNETGTVSEYKVMVEEKSKEHKVRFDSLDGSVNCSCKKFEFLGIQCCHVLKVLDTRNIKELPPQYVLKRWRKDAKARCFSEEFPFSFDGDPQSLLGKHYSSLCRIFSILAAVAAKSSDSFLFLDNHIDVLSNQVNQILQARSLEMPGMVSVSCAQLQNPVESVVAESLRTMGFSPGFVILLVQPFQKKKVLMAFAVQVLTGESGNSIVVEVNYRPARKLGMKFGSLDRLETGLQVRFIRGMFCGTRMGSSSFAFGLVSRQFYGNAS